MVDSESKKIEIVGWENKMGLLSPFAIREYKIEVISVDGIPVNESKNIAYNEKAEISVLTL